MKHWGLISVPMLVACAASPSAPPVSPTVVAPATGVPATSAPTTSTPGAPSSAPEAAAPGEVAATGSESSSDEGELDDDMASAEGDPNGVVREHPLDGWSTQKIEEALVQDPASLGSISL